MASEHVTPSAEEPFFLLLFFKAKSVFVCDDGTGKALFADGEVQQINDERDFLRTAVMAL